MKVIVYILKYKLLIFLKINTSLTAKNLIKNAGSFIVYAGFAFGAFVFTKGILNYLLNTIHIGSYLLHRFIFIILYIFSLAVNVGNIVVSYATLYKSTEVNFLFAKPVSYSKIFIIKFLDNFFYSSATLLLIVCAVLSGYGVYFNMGAVFYPLTLFFIVLPFMFSAASLGVIFLLIIMKLSSRLGARNILILFFTVYIVSLILFFNLSSPVHIVAKVMAYYPNTGGNFSFLDNPVFKLLPNFWASDALYRMSSGSYLSAVPDILLQLLTSIFLFAASILLASKWYYQTWKHSLTFSFKKNKYSVKKKNSNYSYLKYFFKPQTESLIVKEFRQFFRESSQLIHASVLLLLIVIFLISLNGINIHSLTSSNVTLETSAYLVVFLFNVFLISSLALRFVFPIISTEGEAFWKIKSAPVKYSKLVVFKFLLSFFTIFIVGQIINFFSQLKFPDGLANMSIINTAFITLALVSLNFGMGSFFSNFKEKNPIRIASSQGAAITFLLTFIYLVFLIVVLFVPVYKFFNIRNQGGIYLQGLWFDSNLIIGGVSILIAIISLFVSFRAIQRDF